MIAYFWRNRVVLEELERMNGNNAGQAMNPSAIHIPTFIWSVVAVLIGLIIYHMFFAHGG